LYGPLHLYFPAQSETVFVRKKMTFFAIGALVASALPVAMEFGLRQLSHDEIDRRRRKIYQGDRSGM
jgi:hypothetical protein